MKTKKEAEAVLLSAVELVEKIYGRRTLLLVLPLYSLADLCLEQSRFLDAELHYKRCNGIQLLASKGQQSQQILEQMGCTQHNLMRVENARMEAAQRQAVERIEGFVFMLRAVRDYAEQRGKPVKYRYSMKATNTPAATTPNFQPIGTVTSSSLLTPPPASRLSHNSRRTSSKSSSNASSSTLSTPTLKEDLDVKAKEKRVRTLRDLGLSDFLLDSASGGSVGTPQPLQQAYPNNNSGRSLNKQTQLAFVNEGSFTYSQGSTTSSSPAGAAAAGGMGGINRTTVTSIRVPQMWSVPGSNNNAFTNHNASIPDMPTEDVQSPLLDATQTSVAESLRVHAEGSWTQRATAASAFAAAADDGDSDTSVEPPVEASPSAVLEASGGMVTTPVNMSSAAVNESTDQDQHQSTSTSTTAANYLDQHTPPPQRRRRYSDAMHLDS
eukprot:PhM_4_TR11625/c0_g1_i1/m.57195